MDSVSPSALDQGQVWAARREEYDVLAQSYAQMIACWIMPPDDAYHWTRIVMAEARQMHLLPREHADS